MKSKLFSVRIEAKSDFGIKFLETALRTIVKGLNDFKKSYGASILITRGTQEVK